MTAAARELVRVYHQPLWGRTDVALKRSLMGASMVGALVLLMIFVAPEFAPEPVTIEKVPERFARLILEPPRPKAPPAPAETPTTTARREEPVVAQPEPPVAKPVPTRKPAAPPAPRRREEPRVAETKGTEGRTRAQQEVAANLAGATASLDKALDGLAQALPTAETSEARPAAGRRRGRAQRTVRAGRSAAEIGTVGGAAALAQADLDASTIVADGVAIAPLADVSTAPAAGARGGGAAAGASAGAGGEVRSNESLLAVVRRYAPAIQFCYENELKKNPGLRGKLVVSLTVLADGRVSDAVVVDDGLGAPAVTGCALAQIQGWQFPAVEAGVTTFRIPFLFTPPE